MWAAGPLGEQRFSGAGVAVTYRLFGMGTFSAVQSFWGFDMWSKGRKALKKRGSEEALLSSGQDRNPLEMSEWNRSAARKTLI
ncbi:hypothetical protein DNTS_034905 [Danionella cerebrum]|uniref:Uncharacterized protein n=1 Tax=Danionella cerebrum TaxID=2873325 RepID=A0A553QPV8_9TELE|nr:hypothetical protein DNTS_034905 [Danionella translucida]